MRATDFCKAITRVFKDRINLKKKKRKQKVDFEKVGNVKHSLRFAWHVCYVDLSLVPHNSGVGKAAPPRGLLTIG